MHSWLRYGEFPVSADGRRLGGLVPGMVMEVVFKFPLWPPLFCGPVCSQEVCCFGAWEFCSPGKNSPSGLCKIFLGPGSVLGLSSVLGALPTCRTLGPTAGGCASD